VLHPAYGSSRWFFPDPRWSSSLSPSSLPSEGEPWALPAPRKWRERAASTVTLTFPIPKPAAMRERGLCTTSRLEHWRQHRCLHFPLSLSLDASLLEREEETSPVNFLSRSRSLCLKCHPPLAGRWTRMTQTVWSSSTSSIAFSLPIALPHSTFGPPPGHKST
jgi:hypothetical protein